MLYQKFSPASPLRAFVECYYVWESEQPLVQELVVESPPNGFCSIVFNYGNPYFLQNSKYDRLQVPQQFIAGQSVYSYKLFLNGCVGIAGIVLRPTALATLFHLPAFQFTEERIPLQTVFHPHLLQSYIDKINVGMPAEKAAVLDAFMLHHYTNQKPTPDFIDEAVNRIVEAKGMLHVSDLIKDSCMSRRTFERRFFQKVGLSPKYYARVRRIGYLCNLIAGKHAVNWPDVFYECEFYDQAHFIKDFEAFTGRTPQQYLAENKELVHYVQKPVQQSL
jgi:AraC-like DNA-binding protein